MKQAVAFENVDGGFDLVRTTETHRSKCLSLTTSCTRKSISHARKCRSTLITRTDDADVQGGRFVREF